MGEKKARRKPHTNKLHTSYEISGDVAKKINKFCPKCGEGANMAKHKDRWTCGKCLYTEFASKGSEAHKESKKEEKSSEDKKE